MVIFNSYVKLPEGTGHLSMYAYSVKLCIIIYIIHIYIYIIHVHLFIIVTNICIYIYILYANQLQVYVCRISATGLPLKKLRMAAIWFRHGLWNTNRPTINISLLDSAIHPCIWLTSGPSMKEMVWHHPKVYFCRRWEERERERSKSLQLRLPQENPRNLESTPLPLKILKK